MNRFDSYITDYLQENKEVALEKIGIIKTGALANQDTSSSVEFKADKKIATSPELIDYISAKDNKSKHLISSDLESYLSQVREFINIGKSYEVYGFGFIKANNKGVYEFLPYSESNKLLKVAGTQPPKQQKSSNNRSFIQLITFIIVLVILAGLGWQAYQFFKESKTNNASTAAINNTDTSNNIVQDSVNIIDTSTTKKDGNVVQSPQQPVHSPTDTLNVHYIFETTDSLHRAQTRTAQLKSFGNNAGYDSVVNNQTKYYRLFLIKPTKISDTARVRDSIAKFLQKDVKITVEGN